VSELTTPGISATYADLLASGLSPASVRRVHATLHRALADGVRSGVLPRNAASFANLPRVPKSEMRVWTGAQIRAFLEHVAGDRLEALWLTAFTTGMRRGELAGLRWSGVDLDAGVATVTETLIAVGYAVHRSEPKNGRHRAVALDPATLAALRAHRARQAAERLRWGPAYRDSGRVFTREDGSELHPDRDVTDAFDRLVRSAGLPRIRFHDARHSHATAALAAGVPLKIVSDRLGHSSIAITANIYSHVSDGMAADAAARIAGAIFGA
jgi:integrase